METSGAPGGGPEVTGRIEVAPFLERFTVVMAGLFTEVSSRRRLFVPSPPTPPLRCYPQSPPFSRTAYYGGKILPFRARRMCPMCDPTDLRRVHRGKPRTNGALASQFSFPLSDCVPPYSLRIPETSNVSSAWQVPGTDAAYVEFLEPILFPPLSSVLGKIDFGGNPFMYLSVFWQRPLGIQAC